MMQPRVLILRAAGINRDEDAARAVSMAGGQPELVHIGRLVDGAVSLQDYAMLIVPGGFSYGDHLGAGAMLATDLVHRLGDSIRRFVEDGRAVLGICNGFQVLVKSGLLPGASLGQRSASLTHNASGRFECRWVRLQAQANSDCVFTQDMNQPIEVPVAHGEGRFVMRTPDELVALQDSGQVAFCYVDDQNTPTTSYPANPNGSALGIAGVCDASGRILGMMPHPENAIVPWQHPRWTREQRTEGDGLAIFRNGIAWVAHI
jgi:phosphoribosylformylglycinamidine synthase